MRAAMITCLVAAAMAAALASRALGAGADHPPDHPVMLDKAPPGLNELINQKSRIHGYFVNAEDRFFFAGDAAAFHAFLKDYAAVKGIAGHQLFIHQGQGRAKSPWDKGEGKPADWMLEVALVSWREGHAGKVDSDPVIADHQAAKPRYLAEVHFWTAGSIDGQALAVPEGVNVVREKPGDLRKVAPPAVEAPVVPVAPLAGADAPSPREAMDLAAKHIGIKRAAIEVAEAYKGIAEAKLKIAMIQVRAAREAVAAEEPSVRRAKQLAEGKVVSEEAVREAEAKLRSAMVSFDEAEAKVHLARAELALEEARRKLAQAELEEAELRFEQLRARLGQGR